MFIAYIVCSTSTLTTTKQASKPATWLPKAVYHLFTRTATHSKSYYANIYHNFTGLPPCISWAIWVVRLVASIHVPHVCTTFAILMHLSVVFTYFTDLHNKHTFSLYLCCIQTKIRHKYGFYVVYCNVIANYLHGEIS